MGKIFLIGILLGFVWGGYKLYENISSLSDPESLASRYRQGTGGSVPTNVETGEGHDSGATGKAAPVPTSRQDLSQKADALAVLASGVDFLLIEHWEVVKVGDELPDGSVLQSWNCKEAFVTGETGTTERRRFRRVGEALAAVVAMAPPEAAAGSIWGAEK